ncbi:MAG: galactokinase family protein [Breznakiellaceae bacterium]
MKDIGTVHMTEYEGDIDYNEGIAIAQAPGRIHLMGEHGERGAALLLSLCINRYVRVAISLRKDTSLRFFAADLGERKRTTMVNLKYKREDRWANFIKVVIFAFHEAGYPIKGLSCTLSGDIPQQVGLASSSAIEIAAALALRSLLAPDMDDERLIQLLEEAQTAFFGRNDHAIDYHILLKAKKGNFVVADELRRTIQYIAFPEDGYQLVLTDSRVPRFGVEAELKDRRHDLKVALELLSKKKSGASFRDFVKEDFMEFMGNLPEELRRRSLHVVREVRRITEIEEALKKSDMVAFGRAITHSHESLRDLYEVSCPEVDWLVKRSIEIEGVLGSRMTGQGFGGCIYTFLKPQALEEYERRLEDYERIFGFKPVIYVVKDSEGARLVHRGPLEMVGA